MKLCPTASQTVGPYYAIGLEHLCSVVVPGSSQADMVVVRGRVLDGEKRPIPDTVLELWQPSPRGTLGVSPASSLEEAAGFARIQVCDDGSFMFRTRKPSPLPYDETRMQAPHLLVLVFMRGLLRNLVTRMYFPDEPEIATDPILGLVHRDRQHTLIARKEAHGGSLLWDIVVRDTDTIQNETVFFSW